MYYLNKNKQHIHTNIFEKTEVTESLEIFLYELNRSAYKSEKVTYSYIHWPDKHSILANIYIGENKVVGLTDSLKKRFSFHLSYSKLFEPNLYLVSSQKFTRHTKQLNKQSHVNSFIQLIPKFDCALDILCTKLSSIEIKDKDALYYFFLAYQEEVIPFKYIETAVNTFFSLSEIHGKNFLSLYLALAMYSKSLHIRYQQRFFSQLSKIYRKFWRETVGT